MTNAKGKKEFVKLMRQIAFFFILVIGFNSLDNFESWLIQQQGLPLTSTPHYTSLIFVFVVFGWIGYVLVKKKR
jgi:hypothetical protein